MDDLIRRQDAIDATWRETEYTDPLNVATEIRDRIKALPTVDVVERKRGHYIKGENGEWYCSECKRIDDKYSVANFCWYCGADMRGKR